MVPIIIISSSSTKTYLIVRLFLLLHNAFLQKLHLQ